MPYIYPKYKKLGKVGSQKYAFITGITKGIGLAVAERFARAGYGITGCARTARDLPLLQRHLMTIQPDIPVHLWAADLGSPDTIREMLSSVKGITPFPDVLVLNAGLFKQGGLADHPMDILSEMLQVHVIANWQIVHEFLPDMKAAGSGHVFTMCSVASLKAYPDAAAYTTAKFALLGFTKSLRLETQGTGIKVTAVIPGATWSNSWNKDAFPEARLMQAADIAEMIWQCTCLSPSAVVEEIILRPQSGDL